MAGRKRKLGERYPNGELKPQPANEPVVPAIWQRIRTEAAKLAGDARLASEVGRLSFHRELTDLQASVAFRIRDVYLNFEAAKQFSRSARSANYESGRGGSGFEHDIVRAWDMDKLPDGDPLKQKMLAARAAQEAFAWLQDQMRTLTLPQRHIVERLCVDDLSLTGEDLMEARDLLEYIGKRFKQSKSKSKAKAAERRTKLLQSKPGAHTVAPTPQKRPENIDEIALRDLLKVMRPDLAEDQMKEAARMLQVLRDRARHRAQKKRPPVRVEERPQSHGGNSDVENVV